MKKLGSMLLMGVMVMSLAGCGSQSTGATTSETTTEAAKDTSAEDTSAKNQEADEAATEDADSQEGGGSFTVGFDQDFPPMGFVGDNGEYTGFDLDLAKEVAGRLGLEFVPQPIAWDAKDMELNSGTIDCIWNGFTMNGREDDYTWSETYMDNSKVFVVTSDS